MTRQTTNYLVSGQLRLELFHLALGVVDDALRSVHRLDALLLTAAQKLKYNTTQYLSLPERLRRHKGLVRKFWDTTPHFVCLDDCESAHSSLAVSEVYGML